MRAGGDDAGAIAGGVVAAVAGVLLAAGGLYFYNRRRKLRMGAQRSLAQSALVSIKRADRGSSSAVPPPPGTTPPLPIKGQPMGGLKTDFGEVAKVESI